MEACSAWVGEEVAMVVVTAMAATVGAKAVEVRARAAAVELKAVMTGTGTAEGKEAAPGAATGEERADFGVVMKDPAKVAETADILVLAMDVVREVLMEAVGVWMVEARVAVMDGRGRVV